MKKDLFSINYNIPGISENYIDFSSKRSLMDADVLLFSPSEPYGFDDYHWNYKGKNSYSETGSFNYKENTKYWKKELKGFLENGKVVFVLMKSKQEFYLKTGKKEYSGTGRNRQITNLVDLHNNYEFLPIDIGTITLAHGNKINCIGENIFNQFLNGLKDNFEYQVYFENIGENGIPIYVGKDKTKVLGAYYKVGSGFLVLLPYLNYNRDDFTYYDEEENETLWNKDGMTFGKTLSDYLFKIDKLLLSNSGKTESPLWVEDKKYYSKNENEIYKELAKNEKALEKLKELISKNKESLECEQKFKDLLFEQGFPLEQVVIDALKILGYEAENYDDGTLELDQIIVSPEGNRYIGECEGKDNKDINITKYRQLLEGINRDFERDEVEDKAFGILFGNPQRLLKPSERTGDFTDKCKKGAKGDNIALVKTVDLFPIVIYLKENKDEHFKKNCRKAIHDGLGKIVKFPKIPKGI